MKLPTFRYHPTPLQTRAMKIEHIRCTCCKEEREYVYHGPFYFEGENKSQICPWCIASGAAAKKYDGFFVADFADEVIETAKIMELTQQTPGYVSWQEAFWPAHCDDFCAFLGYVGEKELQPYLDEELIMQDIQSFADQYQLSAAEFICLLHPTGHYVGYLFRCLHCGKHRLYSDCS